jgi:hypothetical protein
MLFKDAFSSAERLYRQSSFITANVDIIEINEKEIENDGFITGSDKLEQAEVFAYSFR